MKFVNFKWRLGNHVHQVHVRWLTMRGSDQQPIYKITLKSEEIAPGAGTHDLCNITLRPDRFSSAGVRFRIITPDQDLKIEEAFAVWKFIQHIQQKDGIWEDLMREIMKLGE